MNERLLSALFSFRETGVCLAFSGGVDSTLLLALCVKEQIPVTAVTFQTTLHPRCDLENARAITKKLGVRHLVLEVDETAVPVIMENPPDRCYHCKKYLFTKLQALAQTEGRPTILDGTNADDLKVYRPGLQALRELGVHSPLAECGFTKAEVRAAAAQLGLSVASRPPAPCMATRLPYGTALDFSVLRRLEQGEEALHGLGFPVCRLRLHGNVVRIEVPADRIGDLAAARDTVLAALKPLNFPYYTLDLTGFRSGSMDIEVDRHG